MSSPVSPTPSKALPTFLGILAAFASFALLAVIIQNVFGGKPEDTTHTERLQLREDIAKEQEALVAKYGLASSDSPSIAKSLEVVKARKVNTSTVVVPGTPTAIKAAAAPAPAPEAAAPAPGSAPAPAPGSAPAPAPAAPAPAAPAPAAPAPAAPAPAPAAPAPAAPAPAPAAPAPAPAAPAPAPAAPAPAEAPAPAAPAPQN